jgi:antirestriction protein ArdC
MHWDILRAYPGYIPVVFDCEPGHVFTYNAWRALGRQVRRGEHGVKVCTFVPVTDKDDKPDDSGKKARRYSRPWTATVFHVSQTDPIK